MILLILGRDNKYIVGKAIIRFEPMGNSSNQFQSTLQRDYTFVQVLSDSNFGDIKVYKGKTPPYDYIMILDRYIDQKQIPQMKSQLTFFHSSFLRTIPPMILKVFHFNITENPTDCSQTHVRIYAEYLNFTLKDFLEVLQTKNTTLSYQEILYILNSILLTHDLFAEHKKDLFHFKTSIIFLTPEGNLRFTPIKTKEYLKSPQLFCSTLCQKNSNRPRPSFKYEPPSFVGSFKRITKQLCQPLHNTVEAAQIRKLQKSIGVCRTVDEIKKVIPESEFQAIFINRNDLLATQKSLGSKDKAFNKTPPHNYKNQDFGKKSLKNFY